MFSNQCSISGHICPPIQQGMRRWRAILAGKQYNLTARCKFQHSIVGGRERKVYMWGGWWWCRSDNAGTLNDPSRRWVGGWVGGGARSPDAPPLASLPQCLKRLTNQPQPFPSFAQHILPGTVFLHWPHPQDG